MKDKILLDSISQAGVFSGLNAQELTLLSEQFKTVELAEKGTVVAEGEQGRSFYIVVSGMLEVILPESSAHGNKMRFSALTLNTLKPGDCFGEYSLLDNQPVSASIIAREATECMMINKDDFLAILDTYPVIAKTVYRNLLDMLVGRLRKHDQELDIFLA